MALMHLAHRWAGQNPDAPHICVATVDHGLRDGSRDEAEWVVADARATGLDATLLSWDGAKPLTGVQDAARSARYRLLEQFAGSLSVAGARAVVTAHTEDDQAETLLMRLGRGSGLDGLAGMPASRTLDAAGGQGVALVRPLLGLSGARLRATLRAAGRSWIEDPSNEADRFERVRVRHARAALADIGIDNDKLALSARRLARARDALEAYVDDLEAAAQLDLHQGAYASLAFARWQAAPEETRLRLLGRLIGRFGAQFEPLNLAQLEALAARMAADGFDGATLGGAIVARNGPEIRVQREPGRTPLPMLTLLPGASAVWDRRFRVASQVASPGPVDVGPLGAQGVALLRQLLDIGGFLPARAAATLPAFWREGELVFAPVIADLPAAKGLWSAERWQYSAEFIR